MKRSGLALLWLAAVAQATTQLAVTTTNYEITGGFSTLLAAPPFTVNIDRYTIHSDAVVRAYGQTVCVLNRLQSDNVLSLNAANNYSVLTQFSGGALSNPQDILFTAANRAYLTRYEKTELWIVNPLSGAKLGEISLASYADADGIPEMAQMALVGTRAFVSLQRLDRNNFLQPTGTSALLVLDSAADSVVDVNPATPAIDPVTLSLQNPEWRLRYAPSLQRLVCISPGVFLVEDGGIELVDPFALRSDRVCLSEAALGGDVLDAVIVSPTLGWVLHSDASFNTKLRRFDPSDGSVEAPILSTSGFLLSDLELSPDGRLYIGDRTPAAPGVRIYDAWTGAALGGPIAVGRPPFDLEFVATQPVAGPLARGGAAVFRAYPLPSAGATVLAWHALTPPIGSLRVVDARGRLVRELAWLVLGEQAQAHWDGRDLAGNEVGSGLYYAQADGNIARIVLVR